MTVMPLRVSRGGSGVTLSELETREILMELNYWKHSMPKTPGYRQVLHVLQCICLEYCETNGLPGFRLEERHFAEYLRKCYEVNS